MSWWNLHGHQVISTIVFSVVGLFLFGIFFATLPKVLPFSLKKEMEEDQNVALAIVIGSIVIAMAIIIAAQSVTESPIGLPTIRSLAKPKGAAHHAGHASARSNRQAISISRPQSGHQPVADTIGRSEIIDPITTVAAGI